MLNVNYAPQFGFAGLGLVPDVVPPRPVDLIDNSLSEMQAKMNSLNFQDKEEIRTRAPEFPSQKDENSIYIQDILGSLVPLCPMVSKDDGLKAVSLNPSAHNAQNAQMFSES